MKTVTSFLRLALCGFGGLFLASCGSLIRPLDTGYDPLSSPGSRQPAPTVDVSGPQYRAGQWLETSMPNTAFYPRNPRGNDQPTKVLAPNTPLRVIATEGTYVKVELADGAIGFVPSIMVAEKPLAAELPLGPGVPANMVVPGAGPDGGYRAPDPEIPPISVEDASAVPMTDRIE